MNGIIKLIVLLLFANIGLSQDTTFLNKGEKTLDKELATTYKISKDSTDNYVSFKEHLISGELLRAGQYLKESDTLLKHGIFKMYYENKQLHSVHEFNKGRLDTIYKQYDAEGNIKEIIHFQNLVDEEAEFSGGIKGINKFIVENIIYPEVCSQNGIEGRVYVNFVINKEGKLENIEIRQGAHDLLNNEALKVIRKMPNWKPAKHNGVNVKVAFTMPISFTLY